METKMVSILKKVIRTNNKSTQAGVLKVHTGVNCTILSDLPAIGRNSLVKTTNTRVEKHTQTKKSHFSNQLTTAHAKLVDVKHISTQTKQHVKHISTQTKQDVKHASTQVNLAAEIALTVNCCNDPTPTELFSFCENSYHETLMHINKKVTEEFPSLYVAIEPNRLRINRRSMLDVPVFGETPVTLFLLSSGIALLQNYKKTILNKFQIHSHSDLLYALLTVSSAGKYYYCPGMSQPDAALTSISSVKFDDLSKTLRSKNCQIWHKPKQVRLSAKKSQMSLCPDCTNSENYLLRKMCRATPETQMMRQLPNSNYPVNSLSPKSARKRLLETSKCINSRNKKLKLMSKKVGTALIKLPKCYGRTFKDVIRMLDTKFKKDVDAFLNTAPEHVRPSTRAAWQLDISDKTATEDFVSDQKNCCSGKKGNRWHPATIQIAMGVFSRSPAACQYLEQSGLIKLPSLRHLRRLAKVHTELPGVNEFQLAKEAERYADHAEACVRNGKLRPKRQGILIMDEVKVIPKLQWNSKSHEFQGAAMDTSQLLSARSSNNSISPTTYVLQFLWRDMTSAFDALGPHYELSRSVDVTILMDCLTQTIIAFENYGFVITGIICDGAASNLSLISSCSQTTEGRTPLEKTIQPYFIHPLDPAQKLRIYWIICPSHEVKSLITALCNSQDDGSRMLKRNGYCFGWKQVEDLHNRELTRAKSNILRFIPKLKREYIDRDNWTRLNVTPSRILQQNKTLQELLHHALSCENSNPDDSKTTIELYNYLHACHDIFEEGFFQKKPVRTMSDKVFVNINSGFTYFSEWYKHLCEEQVGFPEQPKTRSHFLSWQTWLLLKVMIQGTTGFAEQFFERNPGYFLSFIKINGSAIESVFSRLRWQTAGKLTSTNYRSAKRAVGIRINGKCRRLSEDYRNTELNL